MQTRVAKRERALGCILFESQKFGGFKFVNGGITSSTIRASKTSAGVLWIRKKE